MTLPEALQLSRVRPGLSIRYPEKFACSSFLLFLVLKPVHLSPRSQGFRKLTLFGEVNSTSASCLISKSFSDKSALRIFMFSEFLMRLTSWVNIQICTISGCRKVAEVFCQVYVDWIPSHMTSEKFLISPEPCFLYWPSRNHTVYLAS